MKKSENSLWFGVAKQKINPPLGDPLMGYPGKRLNTGIGCDLFVRTAVFGNQPDEPAAALAMLDTVYAPSQIVGDIRRAVKKRLPSLDGNAVMIAATHTHSGPVMRSFYEDSDKNGLVGPNRRYHRWLTKTVAASIVQAWKRKRQVTVRHGIAQAHLGHNRRVVVHGYSHSEWEDIKGVHDGYFNPDIQFLTFHDVADDQVRAIIAGYGCHPVTLGPGSLKVSADYPGYLVAALEKATGADVAIHITTGAANINPRRGLRDNPRQAKIMGGKLARAVLGSLDQSRPVAIKRIAGRSVPLQFLVRSNLAPGPLAIVSNRKIKGHLKTEVQAIHFGDLALVSSPGELFAEIATRVRKQSPVKNTIIVEHANDVVGYIFTDAAALEGGYEVCRGSISESMERPYFSAAMKALRRP